MAEGNHFKREVLRRFLPDFECKYLGASYRAALYQCSFRAKSSIFVSLTKSQHSHPQAIVMQHQVKKFEATTEREKKSKAAAAAAVNNKDKSEGAEDDSDDDQIGTSLPVNEQANILRCIDFFKTRSEKLAKSMTSSICRIGKEIDHHHH